MPFNTLTSSLYTVLPHGMFSPLANCHTRAVFEWLVDKGFSKINLFHLCKQSEVRRNKSGECRNTLTHFSWKRTFIAKRQSHKHNKFTWSSNIQSELRFALGKVKPCNVWLSCQIYSRKIFITVREQNLLLEYNSYDTCL